MGVSVLEVLNNVFFVNVSIEGEVSLWGSVGVQIFINGKFLVFVSEQGNVLGMFMAEMIESIEVIMNLLVKYEVEGILGIINIIFKKDECKGFNGFVIVNIGIFYNYSVGLSFNCCIEKFNLFS